MTSLQKNPEAMAAIALTLAEISNIASKMAPGALMALKTGAPAVFALLAAPEFLIAGGGGIRRHRCGFRWIQNHQEDQSEECFGKRECKDG